MWFLNFLAQNMVLSTISWLYGDSNICQILDDETCTKSKFISWCYFSSSSTTAVSNHLSVASHTLLDNVSSGSALQSNITSSAALTVSSAPVPDARAATPPQPAVTASGLPAGFPSPLPAKAPVANDTYPTTSHQNNIQSAAQGSPVSIMFLLVVSNNLPYFT